MDPLSDLLKTVRLTGAVFFEIVAEDPWAVGSPAREQILPKILPGADHLIAYHVVTTGRCFATAVGGQAIPLEAGQVVVFTNGQPHIMSSGPNMPADPPMPDVLEVAASGRSRSASTSAAERLRSGLSPVISPATRGPTILCENLPPVITAGDPHSGEGLLAQFVRFAVAEAADKHAGSESVLTKLSELMFIDVVRRYLEKLPAEQAGWLAGLRDPLVGKALSLMHAKPAYNWTLEELAKQAGLSRSVLAERFTQFVGIPPMQYLTKWRMQIAAEIVDWQQHQRCHDSGPDRLRIRGRLQPRIQEDDRRGALGLAPHDPGGSRGGAELKQLKDCRRKSDHDERSVHPERFTMSALLGRHGLDHRIGAAEAFGGDRDAGIDGSVQQNFGDLVRGDAVVERAAHMHFELMPARQRRQHADIEHAAGLVAETVAQPSVAPALGLGEFDEMLGERISLLLAGIDIGGAEHLAADLGAFARPFCG